MRIVVQRVRRAEVRVEGRQVGSCGHGLLLLVGAGRSDTIELARKQAEKVAGLRLFNDASGKMNLGLADLPPSEFPTLLAVSNFTVCGDASKSRRPSFVAAAPYDEGQALFEAFVERLRELGHSVETGVFGADMQVELINDGPVTLVVEAGLDRA